MQLTLLMLLLLLHIIRTVAILRLTLRIMPRRLRIMRMPAIVRHIMRIMAIPRHILRIMAIVMLAILILATLVLLAAA